MAASNGGSAASAGHQSFEQFISQFSARTSLQEPSSSGSGRLRFGADDGSSSLKPTAAEFVPRWQRQEPQENGRSGGVEGKADDIVLCGDVLCASSGQSRILTGF